MLVTSPLLAAVPGVRHGFSTREGGVSTGPSASLSFGTTEPRATRRENWRRLRQRLSLDEGTRLVLVSQVHGTRVVAADEADDGTEADGVWTARPRVAVGVRTADCAPILMAGVDDGGRLHVAAVHAGWRGAVADIPGAAVRRLAGQGVPPERVTAAIGPAIGLASFEVGDEVIEAATAALAGEAPRTMVNKRGRRHLDLIDLVTRLLARAGVPADRIEDVGGDTFADPDRFYSHRRDKGVTGRHLSVIAVADEARP